MPSRAAHLPRAPVCILVCSPGERVTVIDHAFAQACASALGDPAFAATVEHYRGEPLAMLTEPMLHPGDVAVLLGIPVKTVTQYAREDRLPHYRVGRNVRFLRADVERAVLAGRLSRVS